MHTAQLDQLEIARMGRGAMGMSHGYSGAGSNDAESIRTIHGALDLGVTLIDTAEVHGPYANEELFGRALRDRRDQVVLATKLASSRTPHVGRDSATADRTTFAPPSRVRSKRLGTDHIDLYYQHRVDPGTPIEDTVGALAELVKDGSATSDCPKPGWTPSAAATPSTRSPPPVGVLPVDRDQEQILPVLRELGIGLVAYSPLGRGFLTGSLRNTADLEKLDDSDFRKGHPRFTGENFLRNLHLADEVQAGATAAQVALTWLLAQGDDIVPIPGTKRGSRVEENTAADTIQLTPEQVTALTALPPVEGGHYTDDQMHMIER